MLVDATIIKIYPERSGKTEKGDYVIVPVEIEWSENIYRHDGTQMSIIHNAKVDIRGNASRNFSLPVGTNVKMDLSFSVREWQGKRFQCITCSFIQLRA